MDGRLVDLLLLALALLRLEAFLSQQEAGLDPVEQEQVGHQIEAMVR